MPPSNEKDRKEASAKASPFQVVVDASKSKTAFTLFVTNPKHYVFVASAGISLLATLYIPYHVAHNLGEAGARTGFAVFCVGGLWAGTISSLFTVSIQESINRFRALNGRLEKEIAGLGTEVDKLEETSKQMAEELKQFDDIRKQMESCAADAGVEVTELFQQTTGVFDSMKNVQEQQEYALLRKIAADIEFMDDSEGMNLKEFQRFCVRVPAQYKAILKNHEEETFNEIAGDDHIISYEELGVLFKKLIEQCPPQGGK